MNTRLKHISDSGFEWNLSIHGAYDKRDPDPQKNYGIHGVHIYFTVTKDGEGLTFSVSTGWQLAHVEEEMRGRLHSLREPQAFGVDIHRKTDNGGFHCAHCDITGGECWADGSGLLGDQFLTTLREGGADAVFKRMEQQFHIWAGGEL